MASDVSIGILGPLEVRIGDEAVEVAGPRLRSLVIRLSVDPGRVVLAGQLVDAIWGEAPPVDEANALQSLVSRLRRLLPDLVESNQSGYRLAVEPDAVDAVRFETLAGRGRQLLPTEPGEAAAALAEALALWRGPALADAADADFARPVAARLDELRLGALEDRIEADLVTGGGDRLTAELEELVTAHPLRERLNGQLVRALAAAGRQADALAAYERLRTRLSDELGIDPSEGLQAIQLAVLRGFPQQETGATAPQPKARTDLEPARTPTRPRTNLRAQITSFVGREEDVARVTGLLAEARLVTLVGPGGAGKTRLASEAGVRMLAEVPDGVWMLELAPIEDPTELPHAAMSLFGAREVGLLAPRDTVAARPEGRLVEAIGDRHLLLVVDNCEHLLAPVGALVDRLLARCPELHVLATSREALGITGEVLHPVEPLPTPDVDTGPAEVLASPAVRLFADRGSAARPAFAVNDANVGDVARIARALDGMPLAIELAAARLRALTPEQIAARLDDRFRLLAAGGAGVLARHQTLRAVVDWSWDLLDQPERIVLRRLAVFPGGATLAAAERVCAGPGPDEPSPDEVLYVLASLVDKSLLRARRDEDVGEVRYTMLDTVRAYAEERRREAGEDEQLRRAHAEYIVDFLDEADPHLRGPEQLDWLARVSAEQDNVHAALRWAVEAGEAEPAMRLVALLGWFWFMRSSRTEAVEWADRALALPGEVTAPVGAAVLVFRAILGMTGGSDYAGSLGHVEQAIAIVRGLTGEERLRYPTLELVETLGALFSGDDRRALERAREQFDSRDPWVRGMGHLVAGQLLINLGEVGEANDEIDTALATFRELGERWGLGNSLVAFADLAATRGDHEAAAAALEEAQEVFRGLGDREDISQLMIRMAVQRAQAGEIEQALEDLDAAERIANEIGVGDQRIWIRLARAEVARYRGLLDEARQLLDTAMAEFQQFAPPIFQLHGLLLVARGRVELTAGDLESARTWRERAMEVALATGDNPVIARVIEFDADIAVSEGDAEEAATLLGTADAVRGIADQADPELLRLRAATRAALGDARFDRDYQRGAARRREAVLDELAAPLTPADGRPARRGGRTPQR